MSEPNIDEVQALSKRLADSGKLVGAGWMAYRLTCIPEGASKIQIHETRLAFYAGAQHIFATLVSATDEGEEPSEADLLRMQLLDEELSAFVTEIKAEKKL